MVGNIVSAVRRTARKTLGIAAMLSAIIGTAFASDQTVQTQLDDITLNARMVLADGKEIADGIALVTHGTFAHNRMEIVDALQTALEEREISSLAINLSLARDSRESAMIDCQAVHKHKHVDAISEISAWVLWLKKQGADKIYLVGHSRGGNQTAWYAVEQGDPAIDRVILLAPATWNSDAASQGYLNRHGKPLDDVLTKARDLVATGRPNEVLADVGLMYCDGADVTAESFVSYYDPDERRNTPTLLQKIDIKTLVIAGSEDNVVKDLEKQVEPLADDTVGLVTVDGADHFFLDFFIEDAADAMAAFLNE